MEQEKRLGIAHAVGQLEAYINRPFLLFLGDIFFELKDLRALFDGLEAQGASAVLAVREETDPDAVKRNFSVILREDGTVRRVIEKPRQLPNMLKGCGLYLFDLAIFDAIRHTPRTAMRDEYELTDSIQILIDYDYPVRVAPIVDWDINVTYIGDLIRCSTHVLRKSGVSHLIGRTGLRGGRHGPDRQRRRRWRGRRAARALRAMRHHARRDGQWRRSILGLRYHAGRSSESLPRHRAQGVGRRGFRPRSGGALCRGSGIEIAYGALT